MGYVFRDRFKTEGIYEEKQFYNCIKYIYDNPVKAKICKKPEDYPYSNYKKIPIEMIDNKYSFIDIEEETEQNYKQTIAYFLKTRNLNEESLSKNHDELKKLVEILRNDYKLSLRKIAELLHIGREKVRKVYNK